MKTMINTVLVVVMSALPAVAQSTGKAKAGAGVGAGDYYPLKVGTKWNYELDKGEPQKGMITTVIAAEENADGKPIARLEVYINGQKAPTTEHLMANKDGVFRVKINNQELEPPICILKYPLKAGQKWECNTTAIGQQMKFSCRQGTEEDVQVPAGRYKAIPCTLEASQQTAGGSMKMVHTYWFVDDVGVVKQKTDLGGKVILLELTKFEAAPQ